MDLARETVDVARALSDAAALFEMEAEEVGLALAVETPDTPRWGRADPDGLQVVLKNLLSNAVKFTGNGGRIEARVRAGDDAVTIEIEDSGIGMHPENVPGLFEAFKQASEGVGREYEGTGLGLTVAKEVLDQMDGAIDVDTERDEGTCCTVRLPRAEEAPTPKESRLQENRL
ncbi:MAG: hypothetical protein BRD51_06000 [Bacteroidetes bacterium SW_11_64_17]|nr:MAG: hypothetical protein BRD51_06000 [Bacteroidetes bacterium SW_11_64_17]